MARLQIKRQQMADGSPIGNTGERRRPPYRIDGGRRVAALAQSGSICIFQQHYRANQSYLLNLALFCRRCSVTVVGPDPRSADFRRRMRVLLLLR